jgi:endonuclease/exonuclease/phosphatase family metal-dependent hydrolase
VSAHRPPLLRIASWNILADAYFKPARYPRVESAWFDPAWRRTRIARRIEELEVDAVCLQEVEPETFALLASQLQSHGFDAHFATRTRQPDGCATFVHGAGWQIDSAHTCAYRDQDPLQPDATDSGHIAQLLYVRHDRRRLCLINTHVRWDAPQRRGSDHVGVRQMRELGALLRANADTVDAFVVCGDFNAEPDSDVLQVLTAALLRDAGAMASAPTFNATGAARRIDYVLHSRALDCVDCITPAIDASTPLPGTDEPSDHVPVSATLRWN